jgi:hypothetical protein
MALWLLYRCVQNPSLVLHHENYHPEPRSLCGELGSEVETSSRQVSMARDSQKSGRPSNLPISADLSTLPLEEEEQTLQYPTRMI